MSKGGQFRSGVAIYALRESDSGPVRYIGKTARPRERLEAHRWPSRRSQTPVARWTRKLQALGKPLKMEVMLWCERGDWKEMETAMIRLYRERGESLLNVAAGGLDMAHVQAARVSRPAFVWAMRFCGRTGNREVARVIRLRMKEAEALGPEFVTRFDEALRESIVAAGPLVKVG